VSNLKNYFWKLQQDQVVAFFFLMVLLFLEEVFAQFMVEFHPFNLASSFLDGHHAFASFQD
jgi:hypothetical protein